MTEFSSAIEKLEFDRVKERIIRYAVSDAGREWLKALQPLTSLKLIADALNAVTEIKHILVEDGDLPMEGILPATQTLQKTGVEGLFLQPRELLQVCSILKVSRAIKAFISKKSDSYPLTGELCKELFTDKVLEYNIAQTIDESEAVRANASRELQNIRRAIADRYDALRTRLEAILKSVSLKGFSQEEIITTREGRMVIPVKAEHKNQVRGFIHSASASGATVFIEPSETLELNNEIRSLQFQEQREVERILRALTAKVAAVRSELLANTAILARLDGLCARAKYSIECLGVSPEIQSDGPVTLIDARHPLLLMHHGYDATVPLNIEIGGAYTTLVISGPNAGGKSVAMKTVGLLALMVQSGLHVPVAPGSRFRLFHKILTDIGDEQSIENDLSTFSSHLRNLRYIADQADEHTLVLIDEIGAGTDPSEGGALAAALLELLTQKRACTIATTHHGALKAFAHETPGIENGAMEFDQTTLQPTYRFRSGIPGSSYALEMASRLGFNQELLGRARQYLGTQQACLDGLISRFESSVQRYRKEMDDLHVEKQHLDDLVRRYEARIRSQDSELKQLKQKAIEEARRIVENAGAVIENTVREIRENEAQKGVVKRAHEKIRALKETVEQAHSELHGETLPEPTSSVLEVGMSVRLRNGNETGEVLALAPDHRHVVVAFGNVKIKVQRDELVPSGTRALQYWEPSRDSVPQTREFPRELDLRGMTGEEALPLVDKLIDDAILAGLHRIDIIHGKGTGALRKKVLQFLSQHPRVKSYRLGEWNEGGTGATVVELRDS